jgi:hypothetical protein
VYPPTASASFAVTADTPSKELLLVPTFGVNCVDHVHGFANAVAGALKIMSVAAMAAIGETFGRVTTANAPFEDEKYKAADQRYLI